MAGIPLSALRRALAEISETSARRPMRELIPEALGSTVKTSIGTGAYGAGAGALMSMPEEGEDLYGYSDRLLGNIGRGAAIGAGLGVGAAGVAGARGLRWGLREALAEQAASRGMGRRALREAADAGDAEAFSAASARRDVPLVEDMRAAGQRPVSRMPSAMDEMQELQAASRVLRRLKQERREATDPADIADLDEQISELSRLLGG